MRALAADLGVAESAAPRSATEETVQAAAMELAARAHASGLGEDAVLALVRAALVRAALVRTGAKTAP